MVKNKKYAIVDIETTGGGNGFEKITEIAIVIVQNSQILESYETLINPQRSIPSFITGLTGITNEMVADAPIFEEVADRILEMTDDAIFVAHNVGFDYGFIQLEFRKIGVKFRSRRLCTVQLSRAAFPDMRSFGLDKLIKKFDINALDRHRAMADTQATVIVFEEILKVIDEETLELQLNNGLLERYLPPHISMDVLHELPEFTGVYYYHDEAGNVLYVGKGINIQKKVMRQLANNSDRMKRLKNEMRSITYEPTATKLIMQITEVLELDQLRPKYNLNINKNRFGYCVHQYMNAAGYNCLAVAKKKKQLNVIAEFETLVEAEEVLVAKAKEAGICCQYISTNQPRLAPCRDCLAPDQNTEDHNKNVALTIETLHVPFKRNFVLIDKGRTREEGSVVQIRDGHFCGFGFFDREYTKIFQDVVDTVDSKPHLPVFEYFIKMSIRKKKFKRLMNYEE